jgi:hypothetical protein
MQVVEDDQGLSPGFAGGARITGRSVRFAEVAEQVRLVIPDASGPENPERVLITGHVLLILAEVVVGVPDAVQVVAPLRAERPAEINVAAGLASRIVERREQDERPPLVDQRVLADAEPQAGAAEFIVRAGLRRRVLDALGRR